MNYGTHAYFDSNYRASAEAVDVEALDSGYQAFSYPPLRQALSYESSSPICSGQYASGNYGTHAYFDSTYQASAGAVAVEILESSPSPPRQALSYAQSSSPIHSGQGTSGNYGTHAYDSFDTTYRASAEAVDAEAPEIDSEIEELRRRMNQL